MKAVSAIAIGALLSELAWNWYAAKALLPGQVAMLAAFAFFSGVVLTISILTAKGD